jgi:hypothetical protein
MAKQPDDPRRPSDEEGEPKKKRPEEEIFEAEAVDEDALEIVEPSEGPVTPTPRKRPPTQLAGRPPTVPDLSLHPDAPSPGEPRGSSAPKPTGAEPPEEITGDDLFAEEVTEEAQPARAPGSSDIFTSEDVIEAQAKDKTVPLGEFDVADVLAQEPAAQVGLSPIVEMDQPKGRKGEKAAEAEEVAEGDLVEEEPSSMTMSSKEIKPTSGVDVIAEALESGVDVGREEGSSSTSDPKKKKSGSGVELESPLEESSAVELGKLPSKKKRKKETKESKEADELAAAVFGEPEAKGEMAEAAEEVEEEVAKPPKKRTPAEAEVAAAAEEAEAEEEAVQRRDRGKPTVPARPIKPRYGRRLAAGVLVGLLVAVVAIAGLKYFAPGVLESVLAVIPSSGETMIGKADELKKAKSEVTALRAQQTAAEQEREKEREQKEKELAKAQQDYQTLAKQTAGLVDAEKAVSGLRELLVKANIALPGADSKELSSVVAKALKEKNEAEQKLAAVTKTLIAAKQIDDPAKFDPALIQKLVKDSADALATVRAMNKRLEDALIKEGGEKGVALLLTAKKDLETKLEEVDKLLTGAKIEDPGAKGVKELLDARAKVEKEKAQLDMAIKQAFKELVDANLVPAGSDPLKGLAAAAKAARRKTESPLLLPLGEFASALGNLGGNTTQMVQRAFDLTALAAEVGYYRLREPLIQSPEAKLDTWIAVLQGRQPGDPADLSGAIREADWLRSKEAKASPETRAKALFISGLILRNQNKYTEARQALQTAVKEGESLKRAAWLDPAKLALRELTDPKAFYLPRVERWRAEGDLKKALEELNTALKAIPNNGQLLAERSLVRLDMARATGKIAADAQKEIRKDAQAAQSDPKAAAEAAYVLGQLEEELNELAKAEKHYRQALKAHQGSADEASRYRIALARLLLREAPTILELPDEEPQQNSNKKADALEDEEEQEPTTETADDHLASLILLAITGVQLPDDADDPRAAARLQESIKLAEELIQSKDVKVRAQGHMLLGQAYAKQGRRTDGLREYIKGVHLLSPGMPSKELERLIEEHPAFQGPDSLERPNIGLAETHFGRGLSFFWSQDYAEAEEQFRQAVHYFGQDARYHYLLGLSQLSQPGKLKREAANFNLEQGARLERRNRPVASEVNAILERVQGQTRQLINSFRQKGNAKAN